MPPTVSGAVPGLEIRLLGPVEVLRSCARAPLAQSRKLRALLAILVLEQRPVSRSRLCSLLWDQPSDPRAELRWHISKLRKVIDDSQRIRILSSDDHIGIDLEGCSVDALDVFAFDRTSPLSVDKLAALSRRFRGPFLCGTEFSDASSHLWLTAQRRRFAACEIAILKALTAALPPGSGDIERNLEKWLELAPFDLEAHRRLLAHLIRQGRIAEGRLHCATTQKHFADEGLPHAHLPEMLSEAMSRTARLAVTSVPASETGFGAMQSDDMAISPVSRRSALAVLPFVNEVQSSVGQDVADGLTSDIITRLAKLRSLSIIARGSVYALAEQNITGAEAGRLLAVDYLATGTLSWKANRLRVEIELVDSRSSRLVWTDVCEASAPELLRALDEMGNRIVSALTGEIEKAEQARAVLRSPASLDAWGAHHSGLWHMYRFRKESNAQAQACFTRAVSLDPAFSGAHAGLSFTHWQNAFQAWCDPIEETERAYVAAADALATDERDPAAHLAMGRALWLRNEHDSSTAALRTSVEISPSLAIGHYSLAFVEVQTGDPLRAIEASDMSRMLSPFDPLMFGMLGSRALAHLRLGEYEAAADWGVRAAARPNAHVNILAIGALCLALADRVTEGTALTATIRSKQPGYGIEDFLRAFHFTPDTRSLFRAAADRASMA